MTLRSPSEIDALIRRETVVAAPPLCPELRLHLVTDRCALWRATDADLEALQLDAPYWAFAWAGGQALARHVLDRPERVRGHRVLDFGSGGAIEGIAAARAGATSVLAADIDPYAARAALLNAALNGVTLETTTNDLIDTDDGWDVVLAGDVTYEAPLADRVRAWLTALARRGAKVWVADPNRGFLNTQGLHREATYQAPADIDADGTLLVDTPVFRIRRSRTG